jgi:magnesium transporter
MATILYDPKLADVLGTEFDFLWFSELFKRPIFIEKKRIGKVSDVVFQMVEPHPQAVGIYIEHGWGKPTEFIPWEQVIAIEKRQILVEPPAGEIYAPFVDQPGWILINQHLMGRTILDTDGRRVEVVNDVHLLYSKGRMIIVHVDTSFNGFLRKWHLGGLHLIKDRFISWRYVQPLSVEDAAKTDVVSLSVKREHATELPSEDLADVLEMLKGDEQQALFSALDSEKAAETLVLAEPRAQRQILDDLEEEKAEEILSELSIPQLADVFSALPHEKMTQLLELLPADKTKRIIQIISKGEATAKELMSNEYVAFPEGKTVGEALKTIREADYEHHMISYIYIVEDEMLKGVVDLRHLVLAPDGTQLTDLMAPMVVAAEEEMTDTQLEDIFLKYHYRMIPVTDKQDHLIGVIRFNDIIQSVEAK